jgi:hypothetical protein
MKFRCSNEFPAMHDMVRQTRVVVSKNGAALAVLYCKSFPIGLFTPEQVAERVVKNCQYEECTNYTFKDRKFTLSQLLPPSRYDLSVAQWQGESGIEEQERIDTILFQCAMVLDHNGIERAKFFGLEQNETEK